MGWSLSLKSKKSISVPPDILPGADAIYNATYSDKQTKLSLSTKLEDVINAIHEQIPTQLPGQSEDEVRYFIISILTPKEYKIARLHPRWVLETCSHWQGNGSKLRSLPLDTFAELCPLFPVANIDWTDPKIKQQSIPRADVRVVIGSLVRGIVTQLKSKTDGNQRIGFLTSEDLRKSTGAVPGCVSRMQGSTLPIHSRPPMPFYTTAPAYSVPQSLYGFNNQSVPLLHQTPSYGPPQNPMFMNPQVPSVGSRYSTRSADPVHQTLSRARDV